MNIIYWALVFFLLQFNFGVGVGILLTLIAMLIVPFFVTLTEVTQEMKEKEILKNNIVISIEIVEDRGTKLYLVFVEPNNRFLLQGLSFDEVSKALVDKFSDKNIFVAKNTGDIVQVHKAEK